MLTKPGMRAFDIVQVKEEAPDCFSYILRPADSGSFEFTPGQFLTFVVEINGRSQRRAYSISARVPGGLFQVTIKKVDNGAVSRYIIAHWRAGSQVTGLEPAGRFVLPPTIAADSRFVFIAAGSGITPICSLLQSLFQKTRPASVTLITQFRGRRDIIFRRQLELWQRQYSDRFEWISLLSRPEDPPIPIQRLNNEKLERLLADRFGAESLKALYYICGPLAFMRMAAFTLRETAVPEDNIRRELFDPPREPVSWFHLDPVPHRVILKRGAEKLHFSAVFPDSILDAAAKAGVSIPFSCKAGICSTCTLRCVSGSVTMRLNEVLTDADLRAGLVLTCVGYATSDLVLE